MPLDPALEVLAPLDAPLPGAGVSASPVPAVRAQIALLPEEESAKIKAGEVVERPANVVKELIENALDAGATRITVELEDGGRTLLRVVDNGAGIPAEELALAVQRHATSKIRCLDDIYRLSTLGFRGEGLAAIGAVSRLALASRTADNALGARIAVNGGNTGQPQALALQPGTVAEVRDLFFNVPARLKFLRSASAETSQVAALLDGYALAWPDVRWELRSGGRLLLRSDGDGDGRAVLADLCGLAAGQASAPPAADAFARISFEFPPMAVRGWISEPRYHRHNRSRQWFFVNGRPVSNKLLFRAVDDSVREFMSEGKFPQGAFFIELPPEELDVNVHPMKLEVSFAQPQAVYSLLTTGVRRALGSAAAARQQQLKRGLASVVEPLRPVPGRPAVAPAGMADEPYAGYLPLLDPPPAGHAHVPVFSPAAPLVFDTGGFTAEHTGSFAVVPPPLGAPEAPEERVSAVAGGQTSALAASATAAGLPAAAPHVTAVQQVASSYLALLTPEAVYLVDQHAAHERILFEALYERLQNAAPLPPRQKLLFPLELRLTGAEAELAVGYCAELARLGFAADYAVEQRMLRVAEVPVLLAGRVTVELLQGSLGELAELGHSALLAEQGKRLAASLACRAAIKAGDRLPMEEQRALVGQLLARWSSLSCPHGRPTILRLGSGELAGLFLR
jgi:DNA mismatch repair protein MutL